jgi:hypothetical protein
MLINMSILTSILPHTMQDGEDGVLGKLREHRTQGHRRSPWYRTQGMVFPDGVLGKWLGYRTLDRVCPVIVLGNSTWYLTQDGVCPDSTAPMTEYAPIVPHP